MRFDAGGSMIIPSFLIRLPLPVNDVVRSLTKVKNHFHFINSICQCVDMMLAYLSLLFIHFASSQPTLIEDSNSTSVTSSREGRQYNPSDNAVHPFASAIIYKQPNGNFNNNGYQYNAPNSIGQKPLLQQQQQQQQQFAHDNTLHIYLYQNKLSLYCATDTTYEKITWKKYTCPNQIGTTAGEVIAVGPMVSNPVLYGVNSFGRNEEYVSELLLKQPLTPQSDGAYICEGIFINDKYPFEASSVVRDIIIIGSEGMYQNCFASTASKYVSNSNNFNSFSRPTNNTSGFSYQ